MGGQDDRSLIEATRAGESAAFGILVQRYQDRIYPALLRITGCADDAMDVLQEAFLKAFQKLSHFQGESSFFTWVYRIAVNLALSHRRSSRRSVVARASAAGGDVARERSDDPDRTDPALPLERAELEAQVHEALAQLPPDFRVVVVLKDFDGLRYEEIASIINAPVGTVRSRLHRARLELRERLKHCRPEESRRGATHAAG